MTKTDRNRQEPDSGASHATLFTIGVILGITFTLFAYAVGTIFSLY